MALRHRCLHCKRAIFFDAERRKWRDVLDGHSVCAEHEGGGHVPQVDAIVPSTSRRKDASKEE
jgi:hypothetical protein